MATAQETTADTPLVSVVLPTHNRVDLLRRAVESVFRQSATDFELIIVNDAYKTAPRLISRRSKRGTLDCDSCISGRQWAARARETRV